MKGQGVARECRKKIEGRGRNIKARRRRSSYLSLPEGTTGRVLSAGGEGKEKYTVNRGRKRQATGLTLPTIAPSH